MENSNKLMAIVSSQSKQSLKNVTTYFFIKIKFFENLKIPPNRYAKHN